MPACGTGQHPWGFPSSQEGSSQKGQKYRTISSHSRTSSQKYKMSYSELLSGSFVSQTGRTFTSVEWIQSHLTAAAKGTCSQKINLSHTIISLLARTVASRMGVIGNISGWSENQEMILSGCFWLLRWKRLQVLLFYSDLRRAEFVVLRNQPLLILGVE